MQGPSTDPGFMLLHADIRLREGDPERASAIARQALERLRTRAPSALTSRAYQTIGAARRVLGDQQGCAEALESAQSAAEACSRRDELARTRYEWAVLHHDRGDLAAAVTEYAAAADLARDAGLERLQTRTLIERSRVLLDLERWEEAARVLATAFRLFRNGTDDRLATEALHLLAIAERHVGDARAAAGMLLTVLDATDADAEPHLVATLLRDLGDCWAVAGSPSLASESWRAAAGAFRTLGSARELADLQTRLAGLAPAAAVS